MKNNDSENDLTEMLKQWQIMPPAPGTCQVCGIKHPPENPHNRDSLFYQYSFAKENGRWPTWADASAHCSADRVEILKSVLSQHGVKFD